MAIDATLQADLTRLETTITKDENSAIRARWDYGRLILECLLPDYQTTKKQLPNGVGEALAKELGVCRAEISARLKFARKFKTEAEVSTCVENHGSWFTIRTVALIDKPRPSSERETPPLRRAFDLIDNIDPDTLERDDLDLITVCVRVLNRLAGNIGRKAA